MKTDGGSGTAVGSGLMVGRVVGVGAAVGVAVIVGSVWLVVVTSVSSIEQACTSRLAANAKPMIVQIRRCPVFM